MFLSPNQGYQPPWLGSQISTARWLIRYSNVAIPWQLQRAIEPRPASAATLRLMCLERPEILQEVRRSLNWIGKVLNYIGRIERIFLAKRIERTIRVQRIQRIVVAQWIKRVVRIEGVQPIFGAEGAAGVERAEYAVASSWVKRAIRIDRVQIIVGITDIKLVTGRS